MTDFQTMQTGPGRIAGFVLFVFSLVAYGLFSASFAMFLSFLGGWGWHEVVTGPLPLVALASDTATPGGIMVAVAANTLLVILFGLQHSLMARSGIKALMCRVFPRSGLRILYVFTSSVLLAVIMLLWQPLPGMVWQVEDTSLRALMWAGHIFGWVLLMGAIMELGYFDFTGLGEGMAALRSAARKDTGSEFRTPFLYRFVRHPLMTGLLIGLWCIPTMSTTVLTLVAGFTIYIFIGLVFEERDLIREFGDRYRAYKKSTPSLFPHPFRRKA